MIKESRVKSLYETGLIKYSGLTEGQAWIKILTQLQITKFELESIEKGQIRFKFENPALIKFFRKRLRDVGRTATILTSSETITISLQAFFELLDHVYHSPQTEFYPHELNEIRRLVDTVIKTLGSSLGRKKLKELHDKDGAKSKVGAALDFASKLAGIGSSVMHLLGQ